MTSHSIEGLSDGGLREKIARVISPGAWEKSGGSWRYRDWHVVQSAALAKADAILALSAAPERVEGGGWEPIESAPTPGERMAHILKGKISRGEVIDAEALDRIAELVDAPPAVVTDADRAWAAEVVASCASPPIGAEGGRDGLAGDSGCGEGTQEPSPSGARCSDGRGGA